METKNFPKVLQSRVAQLKSTTKIPLHEVEWIFLEATLSVCKDVFPENLQSELLENIQSIHRFEYFLITRSIEFNELKVLEQSKRWIRERELGKTLQHIISVQYFLSHRYFINENVLVPRPETEILVDFAIQKLQPFQENLRGLEVGLGSGVISIELLKALPRLNMLATEVSAKAIEVAKINRDTILGKNDNRLRILTTKNVKEVISEFVLDQVQKEGLLDFIISNPPYLNNTPQEVTIEVHQNEPSMALFAPSDNLLFYYQEILQALPSVLKVGGLVFFEGPHERSAELKKIMEENLCEAKVYPDLTGKDRVFFGIRRV